MVGYGRIIPQWMIDLPPLGNLNLHGSLLPKYRGAAPIQWAIARARPVTGVTTMRIDAGLDTGDILQQAEVAHQAGRHGSDACATHWRKPAQSLMITTLRGLEERSIVPRPQDNSQATLAPILKREDGRWISREQRLNAWNRLRGFQPWPGAFTTFRAKTLQVHSAQPSPATTALPPGTIVVEGTRLLAMCSRHTALELLEVQMEGKRRMTAQEFLNGYQPKAGERLGE